LDRLTRDVEEQREPLADFSAVVAHERSISRLVGGRTVFDDKTRYKRSVQSSQLNLF
jgi:hypothetical protein